MNLFKEFLYFINSIIASKRIIYDLAKRDYQSQYAGSLLGFLWVYIQPLIFIFTIYIVFTHGFKARPSGDVPFAAWLLSGMIAWLFFASNFSSGVGSIKQHSYLIKKINFQLSILPLVKLLSAFIPHLVLVITCIVIAKISDIEISIYTLQLIYYMFAMAMLLIGLNWLTSATNLFVPDVTKVVAIFVQFGFWFTPIFWNADRIPENYRWILNLNPAHYIVSGYRDSIIFHVWFWEKPKETLIFWFICIIICIVGALVFKRLRPHFAEVV
ncbi:MAG: ABC transporter permease [Candidatus Marithrix sp.]|nr:ABC transporter permease [Candidatus Marithrix sp.]